MTIPALIAWLAADHPAAVLLTTAPDPDTSTRIVYANGAFERLSGYAAAAVIGRSPRLLQGPRTDVRAARLLAAASRAGRAARAVLLNYRRDGSDYLCEVTLQPVGQAGERATHMLGLAREVRRRRGRPAGEGLRFLPVTEMLGLAAFVWPQPGLDQLSATPSDTSRGSTTRSSRQTRTTA